MCPGLKNNLDLATVKSLYLYKSTQLALICSTLLVNPDHISICLNRTKMYTEKLKVNFRVTLSHPPLV